MFLTAYIRLFSLLAVSYLLLGSASAEGNIKRIYIATRTWRYRGNANCTPQEKAALVEGIKDARTLAKAASDALAVADSESSPGFLGWFGSANQQYKDQIKTNHFDAAYSSLSLKGAKKINWNANTLPGRGKVADKSLVFYCPHPPFDPDGDCRHDSIIAMTSSWKDDDTSFMQYSMIALCPKFFTLPTFADAGAAWALSRTDFKASRGANILHEVQHIHRITGNEERCIDEKVRVDNELSDCYTPEICWDHLAPYPSKQRANAQNYRFYAQDALWRAAEVAPPPPPPLQDWYKPHGIANSTSVRTEDNSKGLEPYPDISSHAASRSHVSHLSHAQHSTSSSFSSTTRRISHTRRRSESSQSSKTSNTSSTLSRASKSTTTSTSGTSTTSSVPSTSSTSTTLSLITSTTSSSNTSTTSSAPSTSSTSTTSSTTSIRTPPIKTITSTRTTSSADHGATIIAFAGLVILAGAGGCFYELGEDLFHVDDGDSETAGDDDNVPTSTISFTTPSFTTTSSSKWTTTTSSSTSSTSSSSSSSSSTSTSSREFTNSYVNFVEDLDVAGLDASQCSSLHVLCSPGPSITDVTVTSTTTTITSTTTSSSKPATTSATAPQPFPPDYNYSFDLCLFNKKEKAPPDATWPFGLYVHPTSDDSGTQWWVYVPWVMCDDDAYYTVYLNHSDGTVESLNLGGPAIYPNTGEADSKNSSFPVLNYWWVGTK